MTRSLPHPDPAWVHRSPLQSVGVWIVVAAVAFGFHAAWTYVDAHQRAERDVRIVRESSVPYIRHQGRVHTQDEIVEMLRRRPLWAAAPYAALAALMGVCTWLASQRPLAGAATALGIAVLGGILQLMRTPRLDATAFGFHVFLWLILMLGVRSAVGYARVHRGDDPIPPEPVET
jgi:hypothetical protein